MKHLFSIISFVAIALALGACSASNRSPRLDQDFNAGWAFHLGDTAAVATGPGVSTPAFSDPAFDDSDWQTLRVPHDWSIGLGFTQEEAGGATGYLPGGIGWYRKAFDSPTQVDGGRTWIEFDGVYNNAEVWLNGKRLGEHPYGYTPFAFDLTDHLNTDGKPNTLAVRIDRSAFLDSRWYPGSGIYRNVILVTVGPIHIPRFGTTITTPTVSSELAEVHVFTTVRNDLSTATNLSIQTRLVDTTNKTVAEHAATITAKPNGWTDTDQSIALENPMLWDTDHPNLYSAITTVLKDGQAVDEITTQFGVRSIAYDANAFYVNGKPVLFKGVCLHHDGGLVGAAVPKGVWRRRLERLKQAGVNAIRTAHNPPSSEFLDLCDEMGFLVQNEAFDEWHYPKDKRNNYNQTKADRATAGYTRFFREWAERDIKAMVQRDRNHPSVVMWSIGNEIEWTYPWYGQATGYWEEERGVNYYWDKPPLSIAEMKERFSESGKHSFAEDAKRLSKWVKEVDRSRPVTQNLVIPSVASFSGATDALDIIGYSYRQVLYDYGKEHYPNKLIYGAENWAQWHEWQAVIDNAHVPGIFLWTGINYMGESSNRWPKHGSSSGLLDWAGFCKPSYYMFKALWAESPTLYAATVAAHDSSYEVMPDGSVLNKQRHQKEKAKWGWHKVNEHFDYPPDSAIFVEAYTNCPEAELLINGESFGRQKLADEAYDGIIKWHVPAYQPGHMLVRGYAADGSITEHALHSAGEPAKLKATVDRAVLIANHTDVVHVEVELVDAAGVPVRTDDRLVTFTVDGPARVLGVDNGSASNIIGYQRNDCPTHNGRVLLIAQTTSQAGEIQITAQAEGLETATTYVQVR